MAEDDTKTAVAPVNETGGLDTTRVEPASVEPPPEPPEPKQSITQQLAEQQLELGKKRIEQIDRQISAEEESRTRQRAAEDKERAIKERGATEEIADLRSRIKMREERPKPQPLPPIPRPNNLFGGPGSDAPGNAYATALQVLGSIGSGRTRGEAIIAMKAMSGILKGSAEQYQDSLKTWKEQTQAIEKQNRSESDRYDQIMADNKSTMDDKRRMIELEAMPSHDVAVAEAARRGDFEHISELIDKRYELVGKMLDNHRKAEVKLNEEAVRQDAIGLLDSGRQPVGRNTQYNAAVVAEARRIGIYERGMSETQVDQRIAKARQSWGAGIAGANQSARTGAAMDVRITSAANEVARLIPITLESAKEISKYADFKWTALNQLRNSFLAGSSDPRYYNFLVNTESLLRAWGRAMNPTGVPRVSEVNNARIENVLSKTTSFEAYAGMLQQLWKEVQATKQSVEDTRQGLAPPNPFEEEQSPSTNTPRTYKGVRSIEEIR